MSQSRSLTKCVLIVITRSVIGGAQTYVHNLAAGLARRGCRVVVACQGGGPLVTSLRKLDVPVVELKYMQRAISLVTDLRAVGELVRVIRAVRPDILHLNSSKAGLLGRIAGTLCGVPSIYTVHGWAFRDGATETLRPIAIWSERLAAPLCAWFISPSHYEIALARQFKIGRPAQFVYIPHGLEANAPRAAPGASDHGYVTACMAARFEPPKRQDLLIQAASQVPSVRLVLVGEGEQRLACKELAQNLGIAGRVVFLGNRHDVAEILAQAQIGVMSTNMEAFSLGLLEMMRAGLPVLGTRVGGISQLIEQGDNGFMGPVHEIDWMVEALSALVSNPSLRDQMGAASRARFDRLFTFENMLEQTLALYRKVGQNWPGQAT